MRILDEKLKEVVDILEGSLDRQEFLDAFKQVVEMVKSMERNLTAKVDMKIEAAENDFEDLQKIYKEAVAKIERDNEASFSNVKKWVLEGVAGFFARSRINEKIEEMDKRMNEWDTDTLPETLRAVETALPDMGEKIRDGLEKLEGNERLDRSAIKGLEELLKELRMEIAKKAIVTGIGGGGGAGGGRVVKAKDLSASLDGATKTFSMPSFWRIISVHLSSFPNILRETVDYTVDGSAKTITFTDEIDANSSLATSQTCIVLYSE